MTPKDIIVTEEFVNRRPNGTESSIWFVSFIIPNSSPVIIAAFSDDDIGSDLAKASAENYADIARAPIELACRQAAIKATNSVPPLGISSQELAQVEEDLKGAKDHRQVVPTIKNLLGEIYLLRRLLADADKGYKEGVIVGAHAGAEQMNAKVVKLLRERSLGHLTLEDEIADIQALLGDNDDAP